MLKVGTSRVRATVVGTACLFAAAFWTLDAGNALWQSNTDVVAAFVPQGIEFVSRAIYALVFAFAGTIVGAAVQCRRDMELLAVDQLRESERKYKALMASSFDSIVTVDARARIVETSESAAELLNGTHKLLVGQSIDDYVKLTSEEGSVSARASISAILGQDSALPDGSIAVKATTVNGRVFPAEIRITRLPADAKSAFVLAVRETTSSVVAWKALQHSERRYQSLFDNVLEGVYRSLPDGRLLAANPAMLQLLGYNSLDELTRETDTRAFYADPQQRHKLQMILEEQSVVRNFEFDLRRRDGNIIKVLANIRAITSDNNVGLVYEGSLTDISDLHAARAALEDSEQHFRTLCEHSLDIITVIDADGLIVYNNPSIKLLSGRSPSDLVGRKVIGAVHSRDVSKVSGILHAGFQKPGSPHRFTCRVHRQDGKIRHLESVGTAFLTHSGQLRAVIHSRDISERLVSEAEVRELQKVQVLGHMTSGLAHDFNNLLTIIGGNVEMLDERVEEPALQAHLTSAMNACLQGQGLTRRLMAFMEPQTPAPEEINVNGVLLDLESVLRRSLNESVELTTNLADDLGTVFADSAQLEAAVLQLAFNSQDAMQDNGVINISTRNCTIRAPGAGKSGTVTQCVSICVNDDGTGMDNDVLLHAREPFYSSGTDSGHAGAGLSAARRFAEVSGGSLRVRSEPGDGNRVSILLPRICSTGKCGDQHRGIPGGDGRVLVVDDNAAVCKASAALLRSLGYEVVTANGGEEALRILRSEGVQLLFTDLAMPRLSGLKLARTARKLNPAIKVLLTSGNDSAAKEACDGQSTIHALIRKPFRKRQLAEQVRLVMEH